MKEIKFDSAALHFLDELETILIAKQYVSFPETADHYIENLIDFITKNIDHLPHKKAPHYFSKYGKNLWYIFYKRNQQTTWYIFFEKTAYHYLVRYISNNHVSGKYF